MQASTDLLTNWAFGISLGSVVIALASFALTIYSWHHSGPRLKVKLNIVKHPRDRFLDSIQVEVLGIGRQAAFVRTIELGCRYDTGVRVGHNGRTMWETRWDFVLHPNAGVALPHQLEPTDRILAERQMIELGERWGNGSTQLVHARAIRGDGKEFKSRVKQIQLPRAETSETNANSQ